MTEREIVAREGFLKAETKVLVEELLDLMTNDSENLERTINLLTDDCTWVIEPGITARLRPVSISR